MYICHVNVFCVFLFVFCIYVAFVTEGHMVE